VDISILLCSYSGTCVRDTPQRRPISWTIGSDKTSEIGDDSWILQTRWTCPHVQDSYPTTRRRLSIVHECDGKEGENNLKLDTKSGEIPSRVFIKSKRDSEDENVILPTIDLTFNPFNTPDEHLPQAVPTAQTRKLGSRTSKTPTDRTRL
jgi:hypothetical protein